MKRAHDCLSDPCDRKCDANKLSNDDTDAAQEEEEREGGGRDANTKGELTFTAVEQDTIVGEGSEEDDDAADELHTRIETAWIITSDGWKRPISRLPRVSLAYHAQQLLLGGICLLSFVESVGGVDSLRLANLGDGRTQATPCCEVAIRGVKERARERHDTSADAPPDEEEEGHERAAQDRGYVSQWASSMKVLGSDAPRRYPQVARPKKGRVQHGFVRVLAHFQFIMMRRMLRAKEMAAHASASASKGIRTRAPGKPQRKATALGSQTRVLEALELTSAERSRGDVDKSHIVGHNCTLRYNHTTRQ
jgi:hypothetical protein